MTVSVTACKIKYVFDSSHLWFSNQGLSVTLAAATSDPTAVAMIMKTTIIHITWMHLTTTLLTMSLTWMPITHPARDRQSGTILSSATVIVKSHCLAWVGCQCATIYSGCRLGTWLGTCYITVGMFAPMWSWGRLLGMGLKDLLVGSPYRELRVSRGSVWVLSRSCRRATSKLLMTSIHLRAIKGS